MTRLFPSLIRKAGKSPGTIEHVGERKVEQVRFQVFDFDQDSIEEQRFDSVADVLPYGASPRTSWIDVAGLHDTAALARLGEHFRIHPLVMEDVANVNQRPKIEDYGDYLYIVVKMIHYDEANGTIWVEQVSFVLGRGFVLSFQENVQDVFDSVRERLRTGKGRIRSLASDYLTYALLDAIVDHYFVVLEQIGEALQGLEDRLLDDASRETRLTLHRLRREMILLRRSLGPMRDVATGLARIESPLVHSGTHLYLRDVADHAMRLVDSLETYRDIMIGLQELYLAGISNRLNEVMKVLTIIATVFIPLSFVAGVYGMNFEYLPELHWRWGYPLFWLVCALIGGGMLLYFRKRRWM